MRLRRRRGPQPGPEGELRPSLWSSEQVAGVDVPLLTRAVADGLTAVLCLDLPDALVSLGPERGAALGLAPEALWERALANLDDGLPVQETSHAHGVRALTGQSMFVASRLLALERFMPPPADGPALVAVPTSHVLLLGPLGDAAAAEILRLADAIHSEGPNPVAAGVYEWRADAPLIRAAAPPPPRR